MITTMQRHFVTFLSPGTIVAERTTKPIDSWDVDEAVRMAESIEERYGATPYGFYFTTRARGPEDLDSTVANESGMYYMNCVVRTLHELRREEDPANDILISNMEINKWDRVVQTTKGWAWTQPLRKNDVVLEQAELEGVPHD